MRTWISCKTLMVEIPLDELPVRDWIELINIIESKLPGGWTPEQGKALENWLNTKGALS